MRVGLLIYGDLDILSGGYLYDRKLVSYLRENGDDVEILSLPVAGYWKHIGENFNRGILETMASANIDILIEDELAHPSLFLLNRRLQHLINYPIVSLVHLLTSCDEHPFYSAWMYRIVERHYLNSVSGIIANSRTTLQQIGDLVGPGLPPGCVALPAGDNFSCRIPGRGELSDRIHAAGPLKILVAGNVIRRKGLHVLLQALQELPAGEFLVTVAGRTDMEPAYVRYIEGLVRKLHLENQVKLTGPVTGETMAELYTDHHLMVLPSAYEGYGIVYVEAQQFGIPVIGTTAGAAREIISQGYNGYLIDPEDSKALAGHLKSLHEDRDLLLDLSGNALEAFAKHPAWDESCEIIRQFLYRQVEISRSAA